MSASYMVDICMGMIQSDVDMGAMVRGSAVWRCNWSPGQRLSRATQCFNAGSPTDFQP